MTATPYFRCMAATVPLLLSLLGGCATQRPDPNAHAQFESAYRLYNPKMALVLGQAADAVYEDNPCTTFSAVEAQGPSCDWSDRGVTGAPFRAAFFTYGGDLILAFKGTVLEDRRTLIADVNFKAMPVIDEPQVLVHGEFLLSWLYMKPWVEPALQHRIKTAKNVWITGHSLGGAQAQLAAYSLRKTLNESRIAGVYTFAAPRVGQAGFLAAMSKDLFTDRLFRLENGLDVVPLVPAHTDFQPVGRCIFIDEAQVLQPCREPRRLKTLLLDNDAWRSFAMVPAHFLGSYLDALKGACGHVPSWMRVGKRAEECTPLILRPDISPYLESARVGP